MDEKSHEADLTEKGRNFLSPSDPDAFVLPDLISAYHDVDTGPEADVQKRMDAKQKLQTDFETKAARIHVISQMLKAYCIYQLDVNYVVETARSSSWTSIPAGPCTAAAGARGCTRRSRPRKASRSSGENQTYATITIQNYFRLYQKLAGMTGTAETEANEFYEHLQAGGAGHPDQPPHDPPGLERLGLQDPAREIQRGRSGDPAPPLGRTADPGRHHRRRDQRDALQDAQPRRHRPQRPQRQTARARGRNRGPRRPEGRRHHRHQHGRPRHRHQAGARGALPGPVRAAPGEEGRPPLHPDRAQYGRGAHRGLGHAGRAGLHPHARLDGLRRPPRHRHRAARSAPH